MPLDTLSRTLENNDFSLLDVLLVVEAAELPRRQRQEVASALRTIGRAFDKPLERIPADPRHLAARVAEISPHAMGVTPRRLNNIRSLTRVALNLVRPILRGRNTNPLSPAWNDTLRQLPSRRVQISLSRFARHCSARGIDPQSVSEEVFATFRDQLVDSLLKRPNELFAELLRGWRVAQATVAGLPKVDIAIPDRRNRWTLPWSAFPPSLRADCGAWLSRLAGDDLLDEAPFRPARPSTVKRREEQIRSFASALVLRGRNPEELRSMRDLVELEAFKEGLRYFLERRGGQSSSAIVDLVAVFKAIARHHLHLEQAELDRIGAILRRLAVGRRGLTEKTRALLRQFDDPGKVLALLRSPQRLMAIAARNPIPRAGALLAQMAVAIEILIMTAMRVGNLAGLDIEQNLLRLGRGKQLHIVIPAYDVKNREPLHFPLPEPSIQLIERYLKEFWPLLASPACTALFPGRWGGRKRSGALGLRISKTVRSLTGLEMNPHLFRHAMAKIYLDRNPGGHEVVKRVLGHRSIDTTTRYYTGSETAAAIRHFDENILKLRAMGDDR
jgi:integrase